MSKEAMKLALEALNEFVTDYQSEDGMNSMKYYAKKHYFAIAALREALAEQPAQQQQPTTSTLTKSESRAQCWKCGDSDPAYTDVCQVPACGMREKP